MDETFDFSCSFLTDETKKSQDSNHESFSSDKHSALELPLSENSVSGEASGKELKANLENTNVKRQRRAKQQFTTTHNNHDDRFQDDLMQSSLGLRQVQQDSRNKNEFGNYENYQERQMKAMEDEIHLLKAEKKEILADLGQVIVEKTAKENERKKFELFHQIYRSSGPTSSGNPITKPEMFGHRNNNNSLQYSSHVNQNASTSNVSANSFSKPKATNENGRFLDGSSLSNCLNGSTKLPATNTPSHLSTNAYDEQSVTNQSTSNNSANKVQANNEFVEGVPLVSINVSSEQPILDGGEEINQCENIGSSNDASTCRDEESSTKQSYKSLSLSVQQDYSSNEREHISLSDVPPTSVATTLYKNYKLLLLSLGQMLLSNDVTKLMTWATQNFPIVNPQNATHVLFQLDENEVINASDLSQLRHFFESIVRFDLVYVIDAFLLGDYGILRQITASKKRDVNTQQTSQTGTTTRYQNLFNAASNSQSSLRDSSLRGENSNEPQSSVLQQKQQAFPTLVLNNPTPNDAKFVPRSPNENHSTAYGLQSLKSGAMGFNASQQVAVNGHVTSKLHYCFVRHDIHEKR